MLRFYSINIGIFWLFFPQLAFSINFKFSNELEVLGPHYPSAGNTRVGEHQRKKGGRLLSVVLFFIISAKNRLRAFSRFFINAAQNPG